MTGARLWDEQTQPLARPQPAAAPVLLGARTGSEARHDTGPDSLPVAVAVRPPPELSLLELPSGRAAEHVQLPRQRRGHERSSHTRSRARQQHAHGRTSDVAPALLPMARAAGELEPASAKPAANLRELDGRAEPAFERSAPAGLSAEQLSRVVLRGRIKLQRCYELALRGSASEQTVRTEIALTVSAGGSVVNVETSGQALPGMARCIERAVRKWRFPGATESTHTRFPVAFQPGS
jgi:hypothetical protein